LRNVKERADKPGRHALGAYLAASGRFAKPDLRASSRFPDAVQREAVHRRSGIVTSSSVRKGPGSAAHH
jgi:hypothetical protein